MKNDSNRISLEQRLAKLLGICINDDHEYVSDIFDSLIDIGDSPEDVAEYLTSFVAAGDNGDDGGGDVTVTMFAKDVERYKLGEDIISPTSQMKDNDKSTAAAATAVEAKAKPKILDEAAAQREEIKLREMVLREKQREEQDYFKKKKEEEEQQKRREAEVAAKKKREEAKKASAGRLNQKASLQPSGAKLNVNHDQSKGKQKQTPRGDVAKKKEPKSKPAKKQPEKGTPKKKPCGCYGNKHKPLTNCLRCGRISCEMEGLDDYCHFCGYFIQDFSSSQMNTGGDAKTIAANRHKERLLEFDRTSAQRTHIHDDQEDYFVSSTSMWATEQEQDDALAMEENRQKKLHEKKKQVMNINF